MNIAIYTVDFLGQGVLIFYMALLGFTNTEKEGM